jgi:hypothetical protein
MGDWPPLTWSMLNSGGCGFAWGFAKLLKVYTGAASSVSIKTEPNMKMKKAQWGVLALLTFIALLFLVPSLSKSKARAQRRQTVNDLWSASITLPKTNTLPTSTPSK